MDEVNEEYDTQFFGFSPIAFTDGLSNSFLYYMDDAKDVLQKYLCNKYGDVTATSEIESATRALFAGFEDPIQKCFDRLEKYITANILCIPRHVLLPEDAVHEVPSLTSEDVDKEIEDLEGKIIAESQRKAELEGEVRMQTTTIARLNSFLNDLQVLEEFLKESGVVDLKEGLVHGVHKAHELLDCLVDKKNTQVKCIREEQ